MSFASQRDGKPQAAVGQVQVQFGGMLRQHALVGPAPHLGGQHAGDVLRQAHDLADVANGTPRAEAHHGGAQRGAVAAVALVDPLDDFFPALGLEVGRRCRAARGVRRR